MKKITEYVVAGVKADNEKVFMMRVGELLEKKNLLDFLTEGVPVMVRISDADELLKYVISYQGGSRCKDACEIISVNIDEDFNICVKFKYVYERYWFRTEADRDMWEKDSWSYNDKKGEKSREATEEFVIMGVKYSETTCSVPKDASGIDVAII